MKKLIATLLALVMAFGAFSALAEATEVSDSSFMNGIQFNMNPEQVKELMNLPNPETDDENTRGGVVFTELEYENVIDEGETADIQFLFINDALVAIHYDMIDGTDYETVKAELVEAFGDAVPFDAAKIGNGKYAIDDDGDLKDCKEMIEGDGVTIVMEQDREGDVDVTLLDPNAAYIK